MTSCIGTNMESDAQLVARMQNGDISAFETIVERYRAVLIAKANARLNSIADAEDAAQEAFVQAYLHISKLRDPDALLAWLRSITDHIALMHIRSHREQPVNPVDIEYIAENHPSNGKPVDALEVECILAQLPETMRETVSLTFLAGYTCAEAARIMGVQEGTIKSRLSRARAKLKVVLNMTERDMTGGQPTSDFTLQTIERLKHEMRQLANKGKFNEARRKAEDVLSEQIKPLYGDSEKLGIAKTMLAAFDSGSFKPDAEAVTMLGLPRVEQRRRECEANAAQYGYKLKDLDWKLADVDTMSETFGKPTGFGEDIWGVPVSHMQLDVVDTRVLCQKLRVSPLTLYEWVKQGCPILRCWPFARFDIKRVKKWLSEHEITEWLIEDEYVLERPIRVIFRAVYEGQILPEQARNVMEELGYGVWEAPMPTLKGGW